MYITIYCSYINIYTHLYTYIHIYFWVFRSFAFVGDQHHHWLNKVKKPFFQAPCWFVAQKKDAGNIFDKQLHHIFEAFRLLRQPCHEDAFIPRARHGGGPGRCRFLWSWAILGYKNGEQGSKTMTSCTGYLGKYFFPSQLAFLSKKGTEVDLNNFLVWLKPTESTHMKRSITFRLLS